jgi:hypothetical protein
MTKSKQQNFFLAARRTRLMACLVLAFLLLCSCESAFAAEDIDYSRDIRPILSKNCFFCHGPDANDRKADLRLDSYEGATESLAIDPDDLSASELIRRITSDDPDEVMPTPESHKKLLPEEIDLLRRWVESGGRYADHWSFVAPTSHEPPRSDWGSGVIDQFIHAKLAAVGLKPSVEAEPEQLIRRVSLDLTGVPPSPSRLNAFRAAHAKNPEAAYNDLVDELLASEQFGERMALAWMDAARYGDTSVMHADGPRDMWPWRDWVIKSYNDNKPFSDFLREQLAGDLIPDATMDQKIASGFNRNHASSDEGGAFPEELRVDYVVDRVQTTSNVFLGLSMECAQCHDHKYDPISQKDYYRFFAYFNNTSDPGMQTRNGNQAPLVKFTVGGDQETAAKIDLEIANVSEKITERQAEAMVSDYPTWLANATLDSATPNFPKDTVHHYPLDHDTMLPLPKIVGIGLSIEQDDQGREFFRATKENTHHLTVEGDQTPDLDVSKPFTVSLFLRINKSTGSSAIISRMGKDYRGWDVWLNSGNRAGVHLIDKWPENALKVFTKDPIKNDRWTHVTITYDGSRKAQGIKIYLDGKSVATTVENKTLKPDATNDLPRDTHPLNIASRDGRAAPFTGDFDDLRFYDRVLDASEVVSIDTRALADAFATDANARTATQTKVLKDHYITHFDQQHQALVKSRDALVKQRDEAMKGAVEYSSMVMGELGPDKMRETFVLDRGSYESPVKEEVILPGVPEFLPEMPGHAPANRLGLAEWMLLDDHPLTARVAVNRYWTMLFGRGLSASVMDFGNQGQSPTHPELLDWLARDFIASGWDIKHVLRQIVTSKTYRQSAVITNEARDADPENLLLGRSPRFRLHGEHVRDLALSVAGLLHQQVGGPGVKPYQPEGLWNEVSLNKNVRFVQDQGDKLYRKSMYIYWKRSAPHPAMTIFDAPSREKCTVQRARTNTPLQALVTLNDVQFVEASRHLAERMAGEGGKRLEDQIRRGYQLCVSRDATPTEIELCTDLYQTQLASFQADPARAAAYLDHGDSPRSDAIPPVEHAALTVLANLILNLDETLTRN